MPIFLVVDTAADVVKDRIELERAGDWIPWPGAVLVPESQSLEAVHAVMAASAERPD